MQDLRNMFVLFVCAFVVMFGAAWLVLTDAPQTPLWESESGATVTRTWHDDGSWTASDGTTGCSPFADCDDNPQA